VHPGNGSGRNTAVTGAVALAPDESGVLGRSVLVGERRDADASSAEEERRLVARCVMGEAEAYRPLVVRYQRMAFSVSLRMLGRRADAEDVVQQAFVDAFNALSRFRDDGRAHAFSTWLLRIVINRSKDVLKSKRRTEQSLEIDVAGGEALFAHVPSDPEANAAGEQRRRQLGVALLAIPEKYREVLILKDVEELSYEEMRTILRLPITTLKIRVVRARSMLRKLIETRTGQAP
jgi:RNA polymerase sigma-70 factor (ECF subfamily)